MRNRAVVKRDSRGGVRQSRLHYVPWAVVDCDKTGSLCCRTWSCWKSEHRSIDQGHSRCSASDQCCTVISAFKPESMKPTCYSRTRTRRAKRGAILSISPRKWLVAYLGICRKCETDRPVSRINLHLSPPLRHGILLRKTQPIR